MTEVINDWFKIIEIYDQNTECFFLFFGFFLTIHPSLGRKNAGYIYLSKDQ
ncbi:hypothetical protein [Klebsiella pneumoniae IS43]|uniref:Uncharacterized protein n=1 Tax=Klebsiella pneumoniae IS43 TaxID=1432552 RepID=W1DNG6_KLEPN|nr:hypothetical protein [Klebsiella pneumoniae IS43]